MKILGIGNALVDIMTQMDDDKVLENYEIPKGSMQLCDIDLINSLSGVTEKNKKQLTSGGSAANSIHALARLEVETGFIGSLGSDKLGDFFFEELENAGIKPYFKRSKANNTGCAMALVSPDSERTFATYLGAAIELEDKDLRDEWFKGYDLLYIEGYLVQNQKLLLKAAEMAKNAGMRIALDLASFNIVEDNLEFLKQFVDDYVDILFANEEESKAFTGMEPHQSVEELAKKAEIAVVKIGDKGSLIRHQASGKTLEIPSVAKQVVDTTGAGDAYAAGFLYGLSRNLPLEKAAEIGSLLAGTVIADIGAKILPEKWEDVVMKLDAITYPSE
ncbi:MAG: adenosine kinase [Bacteroidales bacterium]